MFDPADMHAGFLRMRRTLYQRESPAVRCGGGGCFRRNAGKRQADRRNRPAEKRGRSPSADRLPAAGGIFAGTAAKADRFLPEDHQRHAGAGHGFHRAKRRRRRAAAVRQRSAQPHGAV